MQKDNSNDDYHFSEIQKYESLRKFQSESLIDVSNKALVTKLTKMTLKQLQSFFQFKTSNIFSHVNCGEVVEYNLDDDLDVAIDKMNQGEAMGLSLHDSPRLSKKIKGWRKESLCISSSAQESENRQLVWRNLFFLCTRTNNKA